MAYLSMTRLKLKSPAYLIPFCIQNEQIVRQIKISPGFLKGKELATPNLSMWTATLWDSSENVRAFYLRGSHKEAMRNISVWSSKAVTGHQEGDFSELPSWEDIRLQLLKAGNFTNLQNGSSDHHAKIISKPRVTLLTRFMSPN